MTEEDEKNFPRVLSRWQLFVLTEGTITRDTLTGSVYVEPKMRFGEMFSMRKKTFEVLLRKGIIEKSGNIGSRTETYELTAAGHEIVDREME